MLSLWPGLSLLVFSLVILMECRAIAGRVTLPLGGFLMVFCYGAIGAPLLALLLQQVLTPSDATPESMRMMAWLFAPPIEELAKALPVIVLAFLTREARRLSIADLTLIGFASGAGFGFVEGNLDAIVNGTLPGLSSLALGLQTGNGAVFFAGHAIATALVGLAAGIGLRFFPPRVAYAWTPAAFAILWMSFDHGIYNWKLLNAGTTGALPNAHFILELLHTLSMKGHLALWALLAGLAAAQFFEAHLCSKAVGARRDLLLAREWRPWVANEWLVALLRAPLGRAAFGQTVSYFRLRRAFYIASFEARRDVSDPTWTRHAHALEERLKRERSILFDPPPGTWLLPVPVLKTYAAEWAWRMRWVLPFAVLFVLLFLLGPRSLPEWLRQFLYGQSFTAGVVTAGLAFAIWKIVLFVRQPRPDPLAAEGAACAGYYTRALLLGCSFVCGLFPAAALLLGWKAFAPGAAFLSGYLPGWIAQGGNLATLLGLGAIGAAVTPDPRPAGESYRHEIAAARERIRRLAVDIEDSTGTAETGTPGSGRPLRLDSFLGAMAKLDSERDAQARRQLVLDEFERHAGEATITDPAPAAQAAKDEFDRLANELLEAAGKELDAIASIEQAYGRAWGEIMQDLDAHDALRRRLSGPLHAAWQAHEDIGWALRVVEATDEGLLPMQLTLLRELRAVATGARSSRASMVIAGIERIREAAAHYGEENPLGFAGTAQADDDEAALLAEFGSAEPASETPKPFGHRAPQPVETPATPADEPVAPAPSRVQEALDQLIDTGESDARYLETIRHLERSAEALRQPIEPVETEQARQDGEQPAAAAPEPEVRGELEDLLDAIKRDSGYLDFAKDKQTAQADDERAHATLDVETEPAVVNVADGADATPEAPSADVDEPVAAIGPAESTEQAAQEEALVAPEPEPAALPDVPAAEVAQTPDEAAPLQRETPPDVDEPVAVAPVEAPERSEPIPAPSETVAIELSVDAPALHTEAPIELAAPLETAERSEPLPAPSETVAIEQTADASDEPVAVEPVESEARAELEPTVDAPFDVPAVASAPEEPAGELVESHPIETVVEPAVDAEEEATAAAPALEPADQEQPAIESFALVAEAEPLADVAAREPVAARVTIDPSEQLALPLSPARREEPLRTEKPLIRADAGQPVEPRQPTVEVRQPREPVKAEVRTSLFTRLFQSIKRQQAETKTTPAHWDEPAPAPAKPAQPVTPSIADKPIAFEPPQQPSEPEKASSETAAPRTSWLADFDEPKAEPVSGQSDDALLERIEWPALNRSADADVPAFTPEIAPASLEPATQVETANPVDEKSAETLEEAATTLVDDAAPVEVETKAPDVTPVEDERSADSAALDITPADAATPHVEGVASVGAETSAAADLAPGADETPAAATTIVVEAELPAAEAAVSSTTEHIAPIEPAEPAIADATPAADASVNAQEPQRDDEFASKADRLSYLLAKLEQAVQAKVAATTPVEAPVAVADTPSPTEIAAESAAQVTATTTAVEAPIPLADTPSPTEVAAESAAQVTATEAPIAGEPRIEAPIEQTPAAEPPARAEEPVAAVQPAPVEDAPIPIKTDASFRPQKPAEASLKPDRLSYLLDKLFDTAKREAVERPAASQHSVPAAEPAAEIALPAAPDHPAESEILDLRGPEPLPEPPEDPPAPAPLPVLEAAPVEEPVASTEPITEQHVEPTPDETNAAELETPREPQRELESPQPSPEPASAAAAPQPNPSEQATPLKKLRSAEPATHFGSRSRPPRGARRALDLTPKPVPAASEAEQTAATSEQPQAATPPVQPEPAATPERQQPAATPERQQAAAPQREAGSAERELASTPKRDWKLARNEPSKPVDAPATDATKKADVRIKTGSGALATTDAAPTNSPAATANPRGKSYGPRLSKADDDARTNASEQQRGPGLTEVLAQYYAKTGEPQPPMHTTDRATLQRIIATGKLDAPRRRGAAWSTSGMSRRGEVAIRLKPGSEQFIELVPSTEIFGQEAHYYPRGVGKGSFATHIPVGHLEYFDITAHQWVPVLKGRE